MGTSRSLLPLPKTRTSPSSSSTSRTPSAIHSETRRPAPYASSSIARSRKTSGSSSVGAASSRSTSSTRQHVGQRAPALRRLQPLARIAHDDALAEQEAEVGAHRRDVAADRRRREPEVLEVVDVLAKHARRDVERRGDALDVARTRRSARGRARTPRCVRGDAPCSSARKSSKRSSRNARAPRVVGVAPLTRRSRRRRSHHTQRADDATTHRGDDRRATDRSAIASPSALPVRAGAEREVA